MTITLPAEVIDEVDRRAANRSAFVLEAIRLYLDHIRRAELARSLQNPHTETASLADEDLGDWIAAGADDVDLLDAGEGRPVRWRRGVGWTEA